MLSKLECRTLVYSVVDENVFVKEAQRAFSGHGMTSATGVSVGPRIKMGREGSPQHLVDICRKKTITHSVYIKGEGNVKRLQALPG